MRNSSLEKIGNSVQVASLPLEVREYFVDAIEAGKFLRLHWRTVQRLARENVIPAHPFGSGPRKTWRFLLSELDVWMRSQTNGACQQ
jgi:excisionase family DNA binding protein